VIYNSVGIKPKTELLDNKYYLINTNTARCDMDWGIYFLTWHFLASSASVSCFGISHLAHAQGYSFYPARFETIWKSLLFASYIKSLYIKFFMFYFRSWDLDWLCTMVFFLLPNPYDMHMHPSWFETRWLWYRLYVMCATKLESLGEDWGFILCLIANWLKSLFQQVTNLFKYQFMEQSIPYKITHSRSLSFILIKHNKCCII